MLRRPLELGQYTSLTYTDRLEELTIDPSIGSKGDAYDNAMAEAWVATFKSELVDGRRFSCFEHAEHEVLDFIGFYNNDRLHEALQSQEGKLDCFVAVLLAMTGGIASRSVIAGLDPAIHPS